MLGATQADRDVAPVLLGFEYLLDRPDEVQFSPNTERLDLAEHSFHVADTGQRSHFAEPAMYLLETFRNDLKRLARTMFPRGT